MILHGIKALLFRFKFGLANVSFNVTDRLSEIKTVLVCMPDKVEEYGAALKALKRLKTIRGKWKISAITTQKMMHLIDKKPKIKVLSYSKQDITFFGLPNETFKKTLEKSSYDLFLDFRQNFDFFSAALLKITNTPIRVCLDSANKSPFFNILIRVNPAESLADKFCIMIKYLDILSTTEMPATPAQKN